MPYDFVTKPESDYILFTVSGTIESMEDAMGYFNGLLNSAMKKGYSRILVDERKASKKVDQHDCITFADLWTSGRPPTGIRVAAVYSDAETKEYHWIETIFQNRSVVCTIFNNMVEAKAWLTS